MNHSELQDNYSKQIAATFRKIYADTRERNKVKKLILKEFQSNLAHIAEWENGKIQHECDKMETPFNTVIHDCYVNLARQFWKKPQLFYDKITSEKKDENDIDINYIIKSTVQDFFPEQKPIDESDSEPEYEIESEKSVPVSIVRSEDVLKSKSYGEADFNRDYYEPQDIDGYKDFSVRDESGNESISDRDDISYKDDDVLSESSYASSISVKSEPVMGATEKKRPQRKQFMLDEVVVRVNEHNEPSVNIVDSHTHQEEPFGSIDGESFGGNFSDNPESLSADLEDNLSDTSSETNKTFSDNEELDEEEELEDGEELVELPDKLIKSTGGRNIDLEEELKMLDKEDLKERNEIKIEKMVGEHIDYEDFKKMKDNGQLKKKILIR